MKPEQALYRIAEIIDHVDNRCLAADGPVLATLEEMTQGEISEIWELAKPYYHRHGTPPDPGFREFYKRRHGDWPAVDGELVQDVIARLCDAAADYIDEIKEGSDV